MFRAKPSKSVVDIDKYLPELRLYAKEHYVPKPKAEYRYSLPAFTPEEIRFSKADAFLDESDKDRMPVVPSEVKKNLSLLDSPAMKRYYHSWEKKESVTKTFSSEVMRMVNSRYTKMSTFYLPAGIDKRTFHKIKNSLKWIS